MEQVTCCLEMLWGEVPKESCSGALRSSITESELDGVGITSGSGRQRLINSDPKRIAPKRITAVSSSLQAQRVAEAKDVWRSPPEPSAEACGMPGALVSVPERSGCLFSYVPMVTIITGDSLVVAAAREVGSAGHIYQNLLRKFVSSAIFGSSSAWRTASSASAALSAACQCANSSALGFDS